MKKTAAIVALGWTLWIHTQGPTSDSWNAAPGLPSERRCAASMKEKLDLWRQFKDAVFTGNSVIFSSNNSRMSYYCLPDGEDPKRAGALPGKTPN